MEKHKYTGVFRQINYLLYKSTIKRSKKYEKVLEAINEQHGYNKVVLDIHISEFKRIGIGSLSLPMQLLALVILFTPFMYSLEMTESNIFSFETDLLIAIAIASALFIYGYLLGNKHRDKHHFAAIGLDFFTTIGIALFCVLILALKYFIVYMIL